MQSVYNCYLGRMKGELLYEKNYFHDYITTNFGTNDF